jgi:nucleolar pre-ribosomal-associated protein 1
MYLQGVDMQEKSHVMYILNLLKNVLPSPSGEFPNRLPVYSTLILLHALRGIFYPSILTFPLTSRFLLQRPELDTRDVPMLYSMLYNSSENWKKERTWIIRFLADGIICHDDWKVFKRRHTWDLLASLFQSSRDRVTRVGIFDVIFAFAAGWPYG